MVFTKCSAVTLMFDLLTYGNQYVSGPGT